MTLETINYQGKEYSEVSTRLNYFRRAKQYQGWRLKTKVVLKKRALRRIVEEL